MDVMKRTRRIFVSLFVQIFLNLILPTDSLRYYESFYQQSTKNYETFVAPDRPVLDLSEVYQTLNFAASWTKDKLFWSSQDFPFERRFIEEQSCFTKSTCNLPALQVFVVPFSHNDPGWLKTFEDYFDTETRFILDNAVDMLTQLKDMTFVWTEISFLSKWWNSANNTQRSQFRSLLNTGRLEILSGGWVMPDEAGPSLFASSHQLIEGHSWLRRNLNYKPTSSWSLDPFGMGNVMPYLLKNSGLEGVMIQRLHYAWKHYLAEKKLGDFIWNQRFDRKGENNILTLNAPYDLYPTKHSCGPTPEVCMKFNFKNIPGKEDDEHLRFMKPVTNQNILELADLLMGQYRRTASLTRHNIVVTGLGGDFEFMEKLEWEQQYKNYRLLFNFINNNPHRYNATVQFGTLSQYFKAVKDTKIQLPVFQGDFFPYADVYFPYSPAYWTGYYSTRPFWKKLSRETEDELRKAEILYTFTLNFLRQNNHTTEAEWLSENFSYLVQARRWVALFQHHDGITGTSRRPVMVDYAKKLFDAIRFSEHIQNICVRLIIQRQLTHQSFVNFGNSFGNLADQVPLNISQLRDNAVKKIVIFNGIGWDKSHLVRVIVDSPNVMVYGPMGEEVTSQINPKIGMIDTGEVGIFSGHYELVFIAYLAPFSLVTYEIKKAPESKPSFPVNIQSNIAAAATIVCNNCPYDIDHIEHPYISLDNEFIQADYDGENGLLTGVSRKGDKLSAMVNMAYGKYDTSFGSGAYLSRPSTYKSTDILANCGNNTLPQIYVVSGPVLKEIFVLCKEMMISSYVLQQGYPEAMSAVYLTNSVKPLGVNYGEFFMRLQTDMNTKSKSAYNNLDEPTFFTDNGLSVEKRVHVSRLPYEGNIYPVVNYAFIQDPYSGRRFSVLVDRSHGFTSTKSGQLEIIFDRRLNYDDARGMDEGVNDPEDMVSNYAILLEPFTTRLHHSDDDVWKPSLNVQRASKFLNHQPSLFVYDGAKTSGGSNNVPHRHQHMTYPRISLFTKGFPSEMFLLNMRTSAGTSRGVPGRKALLILQNLGHMKNVQDGASNLHILDTDLKLDHFAMPSDLVGDTSPNYYHDNQNPLKVGVLPKGNPFELQGYSVYF